MITWRTTQTFSSHPLKLQRYLRLGVATASTLLFTILFVLYSYRTKGTLFTFDLDTDFLNTDGNFTDDQNYAFFPTSEPSTEFLDLADGDLPIEPYYPYPRPKRKPWQSVSKATLHRPCRGPDGVVLNDRSPYLVEAHPLPENVSNPVPMFGAYGEMRIDNSHCFDRNGRLDPYGFGDTEAADKSWDSVDWGLLQETCLAGNIDLYGQKAEHACLSNLQLPDSKIMAAGEDVPEAGKSRTAVLLRGWSAMNWTQELRQHARSMITELSLHTGGEYAVYLLVEIQDPERKIWDSPKNYRDAIANCTPTEFHNLTILFNQELLKRWYPDTKPEFGGQAMHMSQPLQLFSHFNPQFDFVWGIEFDVRYTGNWYNYLSSLSTWSRFQPRKLQWERAASFYLPSYHGTYEDFTNSVSTEHPDGGIWGPLHNPDIPEPVGPKPPKSSALDDDFEWGVGEEADDITPSSIVNISGTKIFSIHSVTGFKSITERRALMVTPVKRLSRHLLMAMHEAQVKGLDMRSELFAHMIALAHGFKVAAVPNPMYYNDKAANLTRLDEMFNKVFWSGDDTKEMRQLMSNTTYWWRLDQDQYPVQLYRKWYGLDKEGKETLESRAGKLCLPGLMIHPVKDVVNVTRNETSWGGLWLKD